MLGASVMCPLPGAYSRDEPLLTQAAPRKLLTLAETCSAQQAAKTNGTLGCSFCPLEGLFTGHRTGSVSRQQGGRPLP